MKNHNVSITTAGGRKLSGNYQVRSIADAIIAAIKDMELLTHERVTTVSAMEL